MIYRVFATKDSFITNAKRDSIPQTGSNLGASEILEVWKLAGVSGSTGYLGSASLARTLLQFDLSELAALTSSGNAPSTGSVYKLKMYDCRHAEEIATGYSIEILPISSSWDEGRGIDNDNWLDKGVVNWDKSKTSTWWTTTGSDYLTSPTASVYFDGGGEDIDVDVSNIVNAWLTGGFVNNGMLLKLTDSEENDSTDYYTKKLYGRSTHQLSKRPVLEMSWDDSIKDDRGTFVWGVTGSLWLYNKSRGQLTNITGVSAINIAITDQSGNFVMATTASYTGLTGMYSASFVLTSGSTMSGSTFHDMWSVSGTTYMTGSFVPHHDGASQTSEQEEYVVSVKNLKREYEGAEAVRFNMFVRTRDYNPHVLSTASLEMTNTIIEKGYYRIDDALTNQPIIPLGTGSVETTRLSYDSSGNYFKMYMNTLAPGNVYKIVFFFDVDGQLQKIDQNFRFKVT